MARLKSKQDSKRKMCEHVKVHEDASQKTDLEKIRLKALAPKKLISKKMKRNKKKAALIEKLSHARDIKEKEAQAKKKAQTVIVGDIDVLLEALPSFEKKSASVSWDLANKPNSVGRGPNKIKSERTRKKENLADIALFQQVVQHPKFIADPVNAVSDHVQYLVQRDSS